MATTKGKLPKNKLNVRMYRVGFGDCFLVSVPTKSGHDHILVDCGVHFRGDIKVMAKVIDHIGEVTDWKLAVVVASHAHQDHISGFAVRTRWEKFDVGEVWLPWLEDPKDRAAKKLRQKRLALAESLRHHFAAAPPADSRYTDMIINATGRSLDGKAAGLGPNDQAMDLLTSGFDGKATVRYLGAGEELRNAGGTKGLTARILAPSHDESYLSRMDPPKSQRFLRLDAAGAVVTESIEPFDPERWQMKDAPKDFIQLTDGDLEELTTALTNPVDAFALALDKVLNNTSLVVAFRWKNELLLFPGDAQWGNWQSWIENDKDILRNVTFYKVAHHGSHNATPKSALEGMPDKGFVAMASTQSTPWPSIPAPKLVEKLKIRTDNRYIQSDSIKILGKIDGKAVPAIRMAAKANTFRNGEFWSDYVA